MGFNRDSEKLEGTQRVGREEFGGMEELGMCLHLVIST
jgi:hypothetical protein